MSRMHQVVQMGEIKDSIHFYIEDYAYTYLKKQKGKDISKYFLYGEREQVGSCEKVYIYGVGEKPKLELSYFKEYYPVGFLKIKQEKGFWISMKGKEEEITGCFIFYASNQAMQEYLVDHREEEEKQEPQPRKRRQASGTQLPMKEILIPARKTKVHREEFHNEKFLLPIGGIVLAAMILFVLSTPNGQRKVEIMKEVISQSVDEMGVSIEDEFVIEEQPISEQNLIIEESLEENTQDENREEDVWQIEEEENIQENVWEENTVGSDQEGIQEQTQELQEYVVRDGDTLVAICKIRYGSTDKMNEICEINGIENADYIAPGQKIYLP